MKKEHFLLLEKKGGIGARRQGKTLKGDTLGRIRSAK